MRPLPLLLWDCLTWVSGWRAPPHRPLRPCSFCSSECIASAATSSTTPPTSLGRGWGTRFLPVLLFRSAGPHSPISVSMLSLKTSHFRCCMAAALDLTLSLAACSATSRAEPGASVSPRLWPLLFPPLLLFSAWPPGDHHHVCTTELPAHPGQSAWLW